MLSQALLHKVVIIQVMELSSLSFTFVEIQNLCHRKHGQPGKILTQRAFHPARVIDKSADSGCQWMAGGCEKLQKHMQRAWKAKPSKMLSAGPRRQQIVWAAQTCSAHFFLTQLNLS